MQNSKDSNVENKRKEKNHFNLKVSKTFFTYNEQKILRIEPTAQQLFLNR